MISVLKSGVLHYIGSVKPWDFEEGCGALYTELYFENWKNSPFKGYIKYYFAKKFVNDYRKMVKKKIARYKVFYKKFKAKSDDSILDLFYIENLFIK